MILSKCVEILLRIIRSNNRVGNGPHRIQTYGLAKTLEELGINVHTTELNPVDEFEGEIARSSSSANYSKQSAEQPSRTYFH